MTFDDRNGEQLDRILLNALMDFALMHWHPDVQRFRESVANWGSRWQAVDPAILPGSEHLARTADLATPQTQPIIELFLSQRSRLRWEQSYRPEDNLVGEDMLSGYGFAEILGKEGPFVSERVRSGLGVWGPSITYPIHWHEAEEVYVVMGGSADFTIDGQPLCAQPGEVVYVSPGTPHGFSTTRQPLAVFYMWQAGDLRETSTFA